MSTCYLHFDCKRTVLLAMPHYFCLLWCHLLWWWGKSWGTATLALLPYITKYSFKVWSLVLTANQKAGADENKVCLSAWDDFSCYFHWNGKFSSLQFIHMPANWAKFSCQSQVCHVHYTRVIPGVALQISMQSDHDKIKPTVIFFFLLTKSFIQASRIWQILKWTSHPPCIKHIK